MDYTDAANTFYKSALWRRCRAAYISKVFGLCEVCGKPGVILHHKMPINDTNLNDMDITLNHDNLKFLCTSCHNSEHGERSGVLRDGLQFDKAGQLVER